MRILLACPEGRAAPYALAFRQRGWEVGAASDVPMALMAARRSPPDVAVISTHLPGGGGSVLITRLRGLLATAVIPVVALTSATDEPASLLAVGATTSRPLEADPSQVADAVDQVASGRGDAGVPVPLEAPAALLAEARRLDILQETRLLPGQADPVMDRIARLASDLLPAPTALVSLVNTDGQYWVGRADRIERPGAIRQTPLTHSFCQWAVSSGDPVIVGDSREHEVLRHNRAVDELDVIGYAGYPIVVDGSTLGTVCALDGAPRRWIDEELTILQLLTQVASAELTVGMIDRRGREGDRGLRLTAALRGLSGLAGVLRHAQLDASRQVADLVDHFVERLSTE